MLRKTQSRKLQSLEADAASVTKGSRRIIQSRIAGPILFGVLPVRKKRLLRVAILAQAAENVLEALSDPDRRQEPKLEASPEINASEGGHDRYRPPVKCPPAKLWITSEILKKLLYVVLEATAQRA